MIRWLMIACFLLSVSIAMASTAADQGAAQARRTVEASEDFFLDVLSARADTYWHAGDYPSCVRILGLQTDLDPEWVEPYDDAGWLLWSMEKMDAAEALYKKGIAHTPTNYRLYFELGHMYYRTAMPGSLYKKKGKEAQDLYEKAAVQLAEAVKHPHPPDVGRLYAHTLTKLGRQDEAKKAWEGVLAINPTDAIAKRALARMQQPAPTQK